MDCSSLFGTVKPIIGMVHLRPLPGAPAATDSFTGICEAAERDAERLAAGGVDGLMVENYGDTPFYPDDVPKHTVAAMTRVAATVKEAVDCPIGINVLRNDAQAALSVAAAVEADFIRVNVHTGLKATDQGLIEGQAHETLRLREQLGVDVRILADLDVKHAAQIGSGQSIADEFGDCVDRGHADGVIVSGDATGQQVDDDTLSEALTACQARGCGTPIFVGSGVTAKSVAEQLSVADGAIVGTALKEGAITTNPVSRERVEQFMDRVETVRAENAT